MNIISEAYDYFKSKGYGPVMLTNRLIRAEVEGLVLLFNWDDSDESFIKMDAFFSKEQFNASDLSLLLKCTALNKQMKVIKCYVDEKKVVFSAEILLDTTPEIESLLDRLIGMLRHGALSFQLL